MKVGGKFRFNAINFLPLLVYCLCLGATYYAWSLAHDLARTEQKQQFDFRAHKVVQLIEQRLQVYAQVLHGARGLLVLQNTFPGLNLRLT